MTVTALRERLARWLHGPRCVDCGRRTETDLHVCGVCLVRRGWEAEHPMAAPHVPGEGDVFVTRAGDHVRYGTPEWDAARDDIDAELAAARRLTPRDPETP